MKFVGTTRLRRKVPEAFDPKPATPKPYLDPKELAFLGFLILISLYKSFKKGRFFPGSR